MLSVMGPYGQVGYDYDADPGGRTSIEDIPTDQMLAVRSRAMTIEGGTNEIQRRIIAEQILGLPRDDLTDRSVAWRDIPRN
jgi:alkylation response protein AidB-like acyl-CoA dehydrogenase